MEYKVVSKMTLRGLEKEVNRLLKDGWQLQGGFCRSESTGNSYQAMIK